VSIRLLIGLAILYVVCVLGIVVAGSSIDRS
jgi:hypothetical protein